LYNLASKIYKSTTAKAVVKTTELMTALTPGAALMSIPAEAEKEMQLC